MPNTNGVNAIGVWMISCIIMVFGALTEYGIILSVTSKKGYSEDSSGDNLNDLKSRTRGESRKNENTLQCVCKVDKQTQRKDDTQRPNNTGVSKDKIMERIDEISLIIFPTIFILFIIVYLSVLLPFYF